MKHTENAHTIVKCGKTMLMCSFTSFFKGTVHNTGAHFATSFASVVDTGGKFATGVTDTSGKLAAGVNNTGSNLPPVSMTMAANLPPVSMTPVANNGNNIRLLRP